MYELSKNARACTRTPSPIKGQFPPAVVHLMLCAAPPCQSSRPRLRFEHFKGSPHDLFKIVRFRNGPLSVKSLVSTSPILGAPRERAHHSAVASAALAMLPLSSPPVSCFRPWSAQSRHTMPSEETASLSKDAWSDECRPLRTTASLAPSSRRRDFGRSAPVCALRIPVSVRSMRRRRSEPAPPSSSGNRSRRPTYDAESRRAYAPGRPWPASSHAV